ncbi:MAG: methyltransferase domain-containing protein [Spirochaetes bacterium]|nr:methyltransferase domain-containing protein [Spirochaetota bacterium]
MTRPRVPETDQGIQGEFTVGVYDRMQRKLRDKGWIETKDVIKSGITSGLALELGPGPGYLGLEWLKNTTGTSLIGLDISSDMITVAERNAEEYGLSDRVDYVQSSGAMTPFKDETFDAVFTNGSLHEWSEPKKTFDEIWRVLKKGGRVFISDMRRDMLFLIKWFLWINSKSREIRHGLLTSIHAAYTPPELRELRNDTLLKECAVTGNPIGVILAGEKI